MNRWCSSALVRSTLFFFLAMQLYNPVCAQSVSFNTEASTVVHQDPITVAYVSKYELNRIIQDWQRRGYTVRAGTLFELQQLAQMENTQPAPVHATDPDRNGQAKQDCKTPGSSGQTDCNQDTPQSPTDRENQRSADTPLPGPETSKSPEPPQPAATVQPGVTVQGDVVYGGHGNNSDVAKVFFLLAGVVVVAAFIVYAGKTVSELVTNDNAKLWWEVVFNSTFMDTDAHHHGHFFGAKLATGLVSRELFQLALVGEVGNADLDLTINESSDPQILKFSAPYWMLGGAVRMHLSDKLVNASYLYLELMGGTTSDSSTDIIGTARLGASFGVNDSLRLGASLGAQYLDLNENKGFTNNSNDYWLTFGLEIGVRF